MMLDKLKTFFRKNFAKPSTLIRARTTDSARRVVSVRHWGGLGKFYTTDSVRHRDVLLSAEATKNYETLSNGAAWTGNGRPEQSGLRVRPETLGDEKEFGAGDDENERGRRLWADANNEPASRAEVPALLRAIDRATSPREVGELMNRLNRAYHGEAA